MDEQNVDPFEGLSDWAKAVERRAKRAHRLRRLGSAATLRRRGPRVPRRRFRGGTVMRVAIAVITLGLLAGLPTLLSRSSSDPRPYPTQALPAGVYATTTASATASDPFEGTPAVYYPKGEAGITLPAATAVTGFTAAQVDTALQQVRTALVSGRLDHEMLVDHLSTRFVALLAAGQRAAVDKWFHTGQSMNIATWIDPGATLDPAELPRVSGRVTVVSADVKGLQTLQITTNFVWVYAFSGRGGRIAVVHDQIRWDFPADKSVRPADVGMWIGTAESYADRIDCAALAKGLLAPPKPQDVAANPRDTEDPNAFLEPDHTLNIVGTCTHPSASATP